LSSTPTAGCCLVFLLDLLSLLDSLALGRLGFLVEQIAYLMVHASYLETFADFKQKHKQAKEVILVTSGAIGIGKQKVRPLLRFFYLFVFR
jgi:hypothetical protein